MRLLIVGCGYVGSKLAKLAPSDWKLFALTRAQERFPEFIEQNIEPVLGHWLVPETLAALPVVDTILVSVPHRPDAQLDVTSHRAGLQNLVESLPRGWQKLVYLSTTGVYGDRDNEVTEETPTSPIRVGPQIAVEAEQWLSKNVARDKHVILRLAGIYGPGRVPLSAKVKAGESLEVPQKGFLNLVHVADIARMILTLVQQEMQHSCYVFSDGKPIPRLEFYNFLADQCGVTKPTFAEPDLTSSRARRASSKRVDPGRILMETQFDFQFPDYRLGLLDALADVASD